MTTLYILVYLAIGLYITNKEIDNTKNILERTVLTLLWIIIIPCAIVYNIIVKGRKI